MNSHDSRLNSVRHAIAMSGLPIMTGSSQEIDSAATIRLDLLMAANEVLVGLRQAVSAKHKPCIETGEAIIAVQRLRNMTVAGWWIAHRNDDTQKLLSELALRSYDLESGNN